MDAMCYKLNCLYDKVWFVLLTLVALPPLGLYLVWRNQLFPIIVRVVFTTVYMVGLLILFLLAGNYITGSYVQNNVVAETVEQDRVLVKDMQRSARTVVDDLESSRILEERDHLLKQESVLKAKELLDSSYYSYVSLVNQLEQLGVTKENAVGAVDSLGVDWSDQASRQAASYLSSEYYTSSDLIDQLSRDGYTDSEIDHALIANGF